MNNYSYEVENMACVTNCPSHGVSPIPEEAKWVKVKEVSDISGGIPWYRLVRAFTRMLQT